MENFLAKMTINKRINLLIILTILLFFVISSILTSVQFRNALILEHIDQMSMITESSVGIINNYYEQYKKGLLSENEAKKLALSTLSSIRFENNNYVWVNDLEGKMLMHPIKPELNGQNVIPVTDPNGKKIFAEFIKIAKEKGNGELEYSWNKPGEDKNKSFAKMSYIRSFSPWNWVVGAGIYTDEINQKVFSLIAIALIINSLFIIFIMILAKKTIGQSIIKPIRHLSKLAMSLADNDLSIKIEEDTNQTEIGDLNRSFKIFVIRFNTLISDVKESVHEVYQCSCEINASTDQTLEGANQITKSIIGLSDGATSVSNNVSELATGTNTISDKLMQLAIGAKEISSHVENGLANINTMNNTIQSISAEANSIAKLSSETEVNANEGSKQVESAILKIESIKNVASEVSDTINELGKLGLDIEHIVDLIKGLANQTNLLALNAAIEAARAGEHGKGFAVVAEEVKKLASQSSKATDKITAMVQEIQTKTKLAVNTVDKAIIEVDGGVETVNNAGKSLESIIFQVKEVNKNIQSVTKEIDGAAKSSSEVVEMVERILEITEQTAASTDDISDLTKKSAKNADDIYSITEQSAANAEEISAITEQQASNLSSINDSTRFLADIIHNLSNKIDIFKLAQTEEDLNKEIIAIDTSRNNHTNGVYYKLAS